MNIDLESGRTVDWLRFDNIVDELYDVAILPGVAQAEAVGFIGDSIQTLVTAGTA